MPQFFDSSVSVVNIFWFLLSSISELNVFYLGQKKTLEDVTLGFGKLGSTFFLHFLKFYRPNDEWINQENNHQINQ